MRESRILPGSCGNAIAFEREELRALPLGIGIFLLHQFPPFMCSSLVDEGEKVAGFVDLEWTGE